MLHWTREFPQSPGSYVYYACPYDGQFPEHNFMFARSVGSVEALPYPTTLVYDALISADNGRLIELVFDDLSTNCLREDGSLNVMLWAKANMPPAELVKQCALPPIDDDEPDDDDEYGLLD